MEFERRFTINDELFNKYVRKVKKENESRFIDIQKEEVFFLFGFDILPTGEIFHTNNPDKILPTTILDNTVRYNPIINGVKLIFTVHRLQAYKKFKNSLFEEKMIVIHIDTNMLNNNIDNIKIGTRSERMMMFSKEERQKSSEHASSSNIQYNHSEVYKFYKENKSFKKIQEVFGIKSKSTISNIINKFKKAEAHDTI